MRVLVVGSGGREHALVWKILQSKKVSTVHCEPGNGGTALETRALPKGLSQIEELAGFVRSRSIDLTVVGPELPLTQGIVDHFEKEGLAIIGPNAAAARLEGSKLFAKSFMQRHGIPSSPYLQTASLTDALAVLRDGHFGFPLVIKADGLAAGKGVIIANDLETAEMAVRQILQEKILGRAGDQIIFEKFMEGEEVSFLVFSDGEHILPMVLTQDHKRVFDDDQGPNTGGMGAYSADWLLSPRVYQQVMESIVVPTIQGMAAEGTPYRGILYVGLMLTSEGPKVLEFNARMGDPETQPVLFRMKSDLMEVFTAILERRLDRLQLEWETGYSVCVVLASGGYPREFEKGKLITGIDDAERLADVKVFHAGTRLRNNEIYSSGGRVLGVTARSARLESAVESAYQAVGRIHFEGMHYRRDIGLKGLKKEVSI